MTTRPFRPFFRHILMLILLLALTPGIWPTPTSVTHAAFPGANGKIAFSSDRDGNYEIYAMNADGTGPIRLTNSPGEDSWPAWSPDGSKIAFQSTRDSNYEIYVMNADGTGPTNLTNNPAVDFQPAWSPDGTKIIFQSTRDGANEIYAMNADGSNPIRLTNHPATDVAPTWSPDGTKIAFQTDRDGQFEIYVMNADGSNPIRLTNNPGGDDLPDWSPDGTQIVFASNRTGQFEIHGMNADGTGVTQLTNNTTPGGSYVPRWSPDGTKIVFQSQAGFANDIYVINADGTSPIQLTSNSGVDYTPNWQPLPIPNAPPLCDTSQASPSRLWPPNHKLVQVHVVGVTDPDNDTITLAVTSVRQDEPVNGLGDGDTSPDGFIQGSKVLLRAERAGLLNGRVYQVDFTADDGHGGQCVGTVTVCVPHDQSGRPCIDDGPLYDSTQP